MYIGAKTEESFSLDDTSLGVLTLFVFLVPDIMVWTPRKSNLTHSMNQHENPSDY